MPRRYKNWDDIPLKDGDCQLCKKRAWYHVIIRVGGSLKLCRLCWNLRRDAMAGIVVPSAGAVRLPAPVNNTHVL